MNYDFFNSSRIVISLISILFVVLGLILLTKFLKNQKNTSKITTLAVITISMIMIIGGGFIALFTMFFGFNM